ncbi:MAG: glycosyltransferase [Clostridia bacterium]|nr:glycosyltransferase [Clostridia bacterium]
MPGYPDTRTDYPFDVILYPSIDTTSMVGYRTGVPISFPTFTEVERRKPNIIHTHCPMASIYMARNLRFVTGAPVVFTYHTKFDVDIENAVKLKFLRKPILDAIVANIETCDEVWAVSRGAGENLKKLGFRGDYIVMPNGVDMPKGKIEQSKIDELSRRYSLSEDVPVYLFAGRLMWYKGIRIIIDALKKLDQKGLPFRMVFVGQGWDSEEISNYVNECGIADKVIFTGPIQNRDVLRAWYSRAQLFLFPSTFDTNGIVVREAAACGLASVLIKDSCAAEDIEDGDAGFLIEENADSMAQKLTELQAAPERMARVGENAMNKIYFSWEDSVAQAVKRYEVVIRRNSFMSPHKKHTVEDVSSNMQSNDGARRFMDEYRQGIAKLQEYYKSFKKK